MLLVLKGCQGILAAFFLLVRMCVRIFLCHRFFGGCVVITSFKLVDKKVVGTISGLVVCSKDVICSIVGRYRDVFLTIF